MEDNIPLVISVSAQAQVPSLSDNSADIDRLRQVVLHNLPEKLSGRPVRVPFSAVAAVAEKFRDHGFGGRAVINVLPERLEIVDFVGEDESDVFAVALDLGTTHLEGSLLNIANGEVVAHDNTPNQQIEFGADILSRIHRATVKSDDDNGMELLQNAVITSVNLLIKKMASAAGVEVNAIRGICVSGNTTMVHLFLGLNPYNICREPYIPLINVVDPCYGKELSLAMHPMALVITLPSIGSYFGGDLIAGIIASELDKQEKICMLIDVGTNAEVVLGNRDWLIACAGAAGPALEGGVARMGMRAAAGAVERVRINRETWELEVKTIDDAPAVGICGSGLIDLVAELYLAGIVDLRGKLKNVVAGDDELRNNFVKKRFFQGQDGLTFIVVDKEESGNGTHVTLAQTDLDAMMRSKAAMFAILTTLVSQVGVDFSELEHIFVAGAFGKHIDPHKAITLGMLPDLDMSVYKPIGNSSLKGAEILLLSEDGRKRSVDLVHKITYLELNVNQEFMIRFSGSRFIPHTDPSLFPSVPSFR